MTFIQLKIIVLTADLGSVSLAAKELNISQSNASSYIKSVEDELGFKILERSRSGVKATDKGKSFLEHAKKIIKENDTILNLANGKDSYRLRVASMNYAKAFDILLNTYLKYQNDNKNLEIQFHYASLENGIEMLREFKVDILVAYLRGETIQTADWLASSSSIKRIPIDKNNLNFGLRLRKDHPLFNNKDFKNGKFNVNMLQDYPYVDYPTLNKDSKIPNVDDNSYRVFSNHLIVDGRDNRNKVIASTDAYGIGVSVTKQEEEELNIVFYPIPSLIGYCNIFVRKGEEDNEEIKNYLINLDKAIHKK